MSDASDLLEHLGNTGYYGDISYLLSDFKRNLTKIKELSEKMYEQHSELKDSYVFKNQKAYSIEMLRHIQSLFYLANVIFKKQDESLAVSPVKETLNELKIYMDEYLRPIGAKVNFQLQSENNEESKNACINMEKDIFIFVVSSALYVAIDSSMLSDFEVTVTADCDFIYLDIPYMIDDRIKDIIKNNSFEYVVSALILEYYDGNMKTDIIDDVSHIAIQVPRIKNFGMLCSPTYRKETIGAKGLSELFFSNIRRDRRR